MLSWKKLNSLKEIILSTPTDPSINKHNEPRTISVLVEIGYDGAQNSFFKCVIITGMHATVLEAMSNIWNQSLAYQRPDSVMGNPGNCRYLRIQVVKHSTCTDWPQSLPTIQASSPVQSSVSWRDMKSVITDALNSHSAPGPGSSLRIKGLSLNEIGIWDILHRCSAPALELLRPTEVWAYLKSECWVHSIATLLPHLYTCYTPQPLCSSIHAPPEE
jgi:hypothetical protein